MSEPATIEFISDQTLEDEVIFPPGDIYSDEPPLESDLHRDQIDLLIRILKLWWREREDFYASGNLTIYYSPKGLPTKKISHRWVGRGAGSREQGEDNKILSE